MSREPRALLTLTIPKKPTPSRPVKLEIAEEMKAPEGSPDELRLIHAFEFLQSALKDGPQRVDHLVSRAKALRLHRSDLKLARSELNLKSYPHPDLEGVQLWELRK